MRYFYSQINTSYKVFYVWCLLTIKVSNTQQNVCGFVFVQKSLKKEIHKITFHSSFGTFCVFVSVAPFCHIHFSHIN